MKKFSWLTLAVGASIALTGAHAQEYPNRSIKIVVPFPAGGGVDSVARVIGQRLTTQLGQPVLIDNRPGAGANLGADLVAKAPPDGYVLLLSANALATNTTLFPNAPFNALRDFAPVAYVGYAPLVLVVPAASPAKTLKDLIALAKQQPGKLNYASAGNGSSQHLAGEMLKITAQIDVLHVPYKGGAPALTDLLGGRISYMMQNPIEVLPHIKGGQLRPLFVASTKRLGLLPDAPTAAEAGLQAYEATVWWGVVAPVKTPKEIVARLNAEIVKALHEPGVKDKLTEMGVVVQPSSPEQFGEFLKLETDKWARVIKTSGIQAD